MKRISPYRAIKMKWIIIFLLISACVERIYFDAPSPSSQTVIEGMISDGPGPYIVKVSNALSLDTSSLARSPVENAKIRLYDDEGNFEELTEIHPGEYATGGVIQGRVGHAYHIVVETPDGNIFESIPDNLYGTGSIEEIRYEYEARTEQKPYGEVPANVFNVYVDANAGEEGSYVRWRFNGTYKVITYPQFHVTHTPPYTPYMTPSPCSGYIVDEGPFGSGGILVQVGECTCCTCWAKQYETQPHLSSVDLISGNQFKNVKIAEIPITSATFHEKYLVEVEQMSLSKTSFEFFKLIADQKEQASSIFQPPSAVIRGNFKAVNSNASVVGIFWATSISRRSTYITRDDVPYLLTPIDFIAQPCMVYPYASPVKPENWDD